MDYYTCNSCTCYMCTSSTCNSCTCCMCTSSTCNSCTCYMCTSYTCNSCTCYMCTSYTCITCVKLIHMFHTCNTHYRYGTISHAHEQHFPSLKTIYYVLKFRFHTKHFCYKNVCLRLIKISPFSLVQTKMYHNPYGIKMSSP